MTIKLTPTAIEELTSLLDDYKSLDPQFKNIVKLLDKARLSNCQVILESKNHE